MDWIELDQVVAVFIAKTVTNISVLSEDGEFLNYLRESYFPTYFRYMGVVKYV